MIFLRLLDVLAGRKDPVGLYGNIFLNGRPVSKKFQRISGYVVQVFLLFFSIFI